MRWYCGQAGHSKRRAPALCPTLRIYNISQLDQVVNKDKFGNAHTPGLPYAHGKLLTSTQDDITKLRTSWLLMRQRIAERGRDAVFNLTGLERSFRFQSDDLDLLDDELAPALQMEQLQALALDHLGGTCGEHDIAVMNRQTGALLASTLVLAHPGDTVVGVSPSYSHPCVSRAVARAGAQFIDVVGSDELEQALARSQKVSLVILTRLAVSYEILSIDEIRRIVNLAKQAGASVLVDDAGGARVGPAIFAQPRALELDVDVAATGLDKYGTVGPRLGLLGGRAELVDRIRVCAIELGLEARPMLYPAVVQSLAQYRPERVRELVATTKNVAHELKTILGDRLSETPVIAKLRGEDILELAMARAHITKPPIVPYEATAALAMLLLRDHGILTVHFAGLPPGTSALLIKFLPPETIARFGGPKKFAQAIDISLNNLAHMIGDAGQLRQLLLGTPAPVVRAEMAIDSGV